MGGVSAVTLAGFCFSLAWTAKKQTRCKWIPTCIEPNLILHRRLKGIYHGTDIRLVSFVVHLSAWLGVRVKTANESEETQPYPSWASSRETRIECRCAIGEFGELSGLMTLCPMLAYSYHASSASQHASMPWFINIVWFPIHLIKYRQSLHSKTIKGRTR